MNVVVISITWPCITSHLLLFFVWSPIFSLIFLQFPAPYISYSFTISQYISYLQMVIKFFEAHIFSTTRVLDHHSFTHRIHTTGIIGIEAMSIKRWWQWHPWPLHPSPSASLIPKHLLHFSATVLLLIQLFVVIFLLVPSLSVAVLPSLPLLLSLSLPQFQFKFRDCGHAWNRCTALT
ncbi:hypothetical protein Ahy_B03g061683 isoform B [Arachis hypogaea]|uniref:Uncharacterized protein n=1 Tax=Arachis hypogaea TaxID=3818 RepID=A0A444ZRG8_ARAHY|nr:hypothetical protein Ahy_B03g061683 isoform B [Arachis hypogaea]